MINKLTLTGIALSTLIFSACGGGGGSTDPMNDKNYITIATFVPAGICESSAYTNEVTNLGLRDFITRETDTTTSCATYGKVNNGIECAVEYIGTGTKNCVIGFNEIPPGYRGLTRQTTPVELYNTIELISPSFK